jgi:hypothetical protein
MSLTTTSVDRDDDDDDDDDRIQATTHSPYLTSGMTCMMRELHLSAKFVPVDDDDEDSDEDVHEWDDNTVHSL